MTISDVEEETPDLEWFAIDTGGAVGCFTTGGRGFLPPEVKGCREDVASLANYFRNAEANGAGRVAASVGEHVMKSSDQNTYLGDFLAMASKGIYSFDCLMERIRPSPYFLVAIPSRPINVSELPLHLQTCLMKNRLRIPFCAATVITPSDFEDVNREK
jgi:hypothetical protein